MIFEKLFQSKNPDSPRYRRAMARKISGHFIRYVSEIQNNEEVIVGRTGSMAIRDGEFMVLSSADVIFRCLETEVNAWELMSGNGVVITAPDMEHKDKMRTITVYYIDHTQYANEPTTPPTFPGGAQ